MIFEERFDLFAIILELLLQSAQEFTQAQSQAALGLGDRLP